MNILLNVTKETDSSDSNIMKHIALITEKPRLSGKNSIPDGAVTGNGDLAAILGNSENGMRIHLAKSDLWYAAEHHDCGGIRPLGNVDIDVPEDMYVDYFACQNADEGRVYCKFEKNDRLIEINLTVCKGKNLLVIDISGKGELPVPRLCAVSGNCDGKYGKTEEGFIYRIFEGEECVYKTEIYAKMKQTDANQYCVYAVTNHDVDNPLEECGKYIDSLDETAVEALKTEHLELWQDFWSKSRMKLSDEKLENGWYQSIYLVACTAGNKKFPPGLFGNLITVEKPGWKSDYHLNYNYQATFYAACSSNHVELTDGYHVPLEQFMKTGREYAKKFGCGGIILPVGILPGGYISEYTPGIRYPFLRLFLGQKNNQLHPADIMIFRWKTTRDTEYAKNHAYPYLKECLQFFEDYAVYENGRYNILKDAAHEVPYYKPDFTEEKYKKTVNDKNNVLTLGLLRMGLEAGIDMARALGIDEDKQAKWKDMLDKTAPFPTFIKRARRVYRYTEKGQAWNDTNSVGLQHIYPCGCIDLNSDEKTLKIARNSLTLNNRWFDDNASNSVFPAAVRIGIEPAVIMKNLRKNLDRFLLGNYMHLHHGGGMENCSVIPNTINEMALQSNKSILRFFPVWDKSIDCEFENLRAEGAFLVSGSIKNGKIDKITVKSEKGENLTYIDPFTNQKITRSTFPGESITIGE